MLMVDTVNIFSETVYNFLDNFAMLFSNTWFTINKTSSILFWPLGK